MGISNNNIKLLVDIQRKCLIDKITKISSNGTIVQAHSTQLSTISEKDTGPVVFPLLQKCKSITISNGEYQSPCDDVVHHIL